MPPVSIPGSAPAVDVRNGSSLVLISEKSVGDCMAIFHLFDGTALASAISALTVTLFKKGPLWGNRRLPYVTVISEIDVQIELLMVSKFST